MRLPLLLGLSGLVALPFFACSSKSDDASAASDGGPDAADTRPPTPPEWDRAVVRPDEATAKAGRAACKFARGALPAETLGTGTPVDKDIPIETIIVLMQENRSFDTYFGHLNKYAGRTDLESAPDGAMQPTLVGAAPGAMHAYQHAKHTCFLDTNHEWSGSHVQYDDGKMDGFFQTNQNYGGETLPNPTPDLKDGERALWWYDERELPFYYKLASTFGIADHYHCSLLGPTWPNRDYLYAATSFGQTHNKFPDLSASPFPTNDVVLFDELEKRHVNWNVYTANLPGAAVTVGPSISTRWERNPVHTIEDFLADAAAGSLPPVVFLDAYIGAEGPSRSDEHPPADVQVGQKFTSDIVHALFKSPQWKTSALFITWDEHGGTYDHVPPPAACPPDNLQPILEGGDTTQGKFDRLGVRVPLLVVSPYAKKGYASHLVYDHAAITRFIETKFKLPALTGRDANAESLADFFDFAHPPFVAPPDLPEPTVDPTELAYCEKTFAKQ